MKLEEMIHKYIINHNNQHIYQKVLDHLKNNIKTCLLFLQNQHFIKLYQIVHFSKIKSFMKNIDFFIFI
jgi:hypothetical protein